MPKARFVAFTQNFQQAILQQNQIIDTIHNVIQIRLENIFFKLINTIVSNLSKRDIKTLLTFYLSFVQLILIKLYKYVERVKRNKKVCTK